MFFSCSSAAEAVFLFSFSRRVLSAACKDTNNLLIAKMF